MAQPPDNWFELDSFAVYGLGRSGRAAANLLASRGKHVVASDTRSQSEFEDLDQLHSGVRRIFGRNDHAGAEAVILSPGIRPHSETVERLRDAQCWVFSEIDLAFDASDAEFVAITGTDGKTTTTRLCGEVFRAADRDVAVAGNIGTPLTEAVCDEPDWIVAEVSAFQLWSSRHCSPAVSGFTNIAADHLDYFDEWSDYVESKRRLLELTRDDGTVILNVDDEILAGWISRVRPRSLGAYSLVSRPEGADLALWASAGNLYGSRPEEESQSEPSDSEVLLDASDWLLPGSHNLANAMCAAGLGLASGIDATEVRSGLAQFEGLPHRSELCREWRGIEIYNDSKATNVQSAIAGLKSLPRPYVAIVGGLDKGLDLAPLVDELAEGAAGVVLIGDISSRLRAALEADSEASELAIETAESMSAAVELATDVASRLDARAISLSPAASSFDMYDSYEHRGEVFRDVVSALEL